MFRIIDINELISLLDGYNHKELHIHHTWRPNHEIYYNKPDGLYWQEAMKGFHVDTNGWRDIAQHVTLLPDGLFVTGRDFAMDPASIKGYNNGAFMVEMIGDFDIGKDPFDGPQRESALNITRYFDRQGKYIRFHNENSTKTCPGSSIHKYGFMNSVRDVSQTYPLPTLREGSRGAEVKLFQEKLSLLGYDAGNADGIFGPKTKAAIINFQNDNELQPDGIYGPKSREKFEITLRDKDNNASNNGSDHTPSTEEILHRLNELEGRANDLLREIEDLKEIIPKN